MCIQTRLRYLNRIHDFVHHAVGCLVKHNLQSRRSVVVRVCGRDRRPGWIQRRVGSCPICLRDCIHPHWVLRPRLTVNGGHLRGQRRAVLLYHWLELCDPLPILCIMSRPPVFSIDWSRSQEYAFHPAGTEGHSPDRETLLHLRADSSW